MPDLELYRDAIVAYRKWLERQSTLPCERFIQRLDSAQEPRVEGALGEALAWNWLQPRSSAIRLNEDQVRGGVDFACASDGRAYYVEVSTLTTEIVTKETGLPELPSAGAKSYRPATRAVMRKVQGKAEQAAGLDKPYLLFIPILHIQASAITLSTAHLEQVLVGSTGVGGAFDRAAGAVVGGLHSVAMLDYPCFFRPGTVEPIRRHMSAVLVGGFGLVPPDCTVGGVLHPDPLRPFDRACLPDACFGRLDPWPPADRLRIVWERADGTRCDDEAERERRSKEAEARLRKAGLGPYLDEVAREIEQRTASRGRGAHSHNLDPLSAELGLGVPSVVPSPRNRSPSCRQLASPSI